MSTPPGDEAAWLWSAYCTRACDRPIPGGDAGITQGWARPGGGRPLSVGVGLNGVHPYVDGYVQLRTGRNPFGLGARLGVPVQSWREHQVYGRYDVRISSSSRVLLNPALFIHEGSSPNGESTGSFIGFVQGVGILLEGERASWTPAIALIAGRTTRDVYGERSGPTWSVFGAASLGLTLHAPRTRAR